MPRKPKAKNTLSAGERVAIYEAEQEERRKRMLNEGEKSADASGEQIPEGAREPEKVAVATQAKKILQKPQYAVVNVDFSIPVGEIRPVHGMCNGPVSYGSDLKAAFREIGVPYVRFDCTDTAVSAFAVDISRIFKDADADPSIEENYDFAYTDKYVEAAIMSGAKVIYRLGESCDIFSSGKKIVFPEDLDAFARVCVNIIRHYNAGWANGYSIGIDRFEIWSHEKGATLISELELYKRVAFAIKNYDEGISVGGIGFDGFDSAAREFVRLCAKGRVPLDFISMSSFASDPCELTRQVDDAVAYMRNLGLRNAEVLIGKWCYVDDAACDGVSIEKLISCEGESFFERRKMMFESQSSVKGAAYDVAVLLSLCGKNEVMAACHYDAQPNLSAWCSLFDRYGNKQKPFYSFNAFGELYRAKDLVLCDCISSEEYAHPGIYASAAFSSSGEGYVMIASFNGCGVVDLRLDGIPEDIYTADVYMLDGVKDMTLGDSIPISGMKKRLLLNVSEYGVILIKLY